MIAGADVEARRACPIPLWNACSSLYASVALTFQQTVCRP
jgi:hypothetical protein